MSPRSAASGGFRFVEEVLGDPLGFFPSLQIEERPYNLWLTERVLEPSLAAWAGRAGAPVPMAQVGHDFRRASVLSRDCFRRILPVAVGAGDAAVLAALGVTANLQRTLALIGEFMAAGGGIAGAAEGAPADFALSRLWCGLIEYAPGARYFPARLHPPEHAAALNLRRREVRHLSNALWCSPSSIRRRCDEAIQALRREIRGSGLFEPDDLRHLHGHPVPAHFRARKKPGPRGNP